MRKEQEWLPCLAPLLSCSILEPVHAGTPTDGTIIETGTDSYGLASTRARAEEAAKAS
ncbi:hypothetical protein [Streptomyces sp. A1547]|uniref:hypothetical protein n=1 Tax=Streptomyces sp. A1547 TaxID=2563105 RepID=UPI001F0E6A3E|nr:hypothetical protein [Streptomyces sp. A1547]